MLHNLTQLLFHLRNYLFGYHIAHNSRLKTTYACTLVCLINYVNTTLLNDIITTFKRWKDAAIHTWLHIMHVIIVTWA